MERDKWFFRNAELLEQVTRHAGVLAYYCITFLKRFNSPAGDITQVADGRRDDRKYASLRETLLHCSIASLLASGINSARGQR